jgi:hypothetical protein
MLLVVWHWCETQSISTAINASESWMHVVTVSGFSTLDAPEWSVMISDVLKIFITEVTVGVVSPL